MLLPTMPAPMITTLAVVGKLPINGAPCRFGPRASQGPLVTLAAGDGGAVRRGFSYRRTLTVDNRHVNRRMWSHTIWSRPPPFVQGPRLGEAHEHVRAQAAVGVHQRSAPRRDPGRTPRGR